MTVRTRFAPSPTGFMHIGGMRTALFNWLWARRNGGSFILRIDDTDAARNLDEALQPILDAFRWLGLDWDEGPEVGGDYGPYFQSQRRHLHDAALKELLDSGHVYRDFEPKEVTQADAERQKKETGVFLNSRSSLELSESDIAAKLEAGEPHVIRLRIPRDQKVEIEDHVRGHVEWDCGKMSDPGIARDDGSPLYNFACVVDDAQLEITHVIRAEEHLSNTPVQVLIYQAMGLECPQFAHIPFVAAPGGKKKLSKREQYRNNRSFQKLFQLSDAVLPHIGASEDLTPVLVEWYQQVGFLPAGVLNGLARLGWSLDDSTEIMSLQTILDNFSLDRVVKASASLDPDKLLSFQTHWFGQLDAAEKRTQCLSILQRAGLIAADDDVATARLDNVLALAADRLRVSGDILAFDEFFVAADQLQYSEKDFQKRLVKPDDALSILSEIRSQLADSGVWSESALHDIVHGFVESKELKFGQVAPALRVAVTGKGKGADLFPTLEVLGRDECLSRIDRAIGLAESART